MKKILLFVSIVATVLVLIMFVVMFLVYKQSSSMAYAEHIESPSRMAINEPIPFPDMAKDLCYYFRGLYSCFEYNIDENSLLEFVSQKYPMMQIGEIRTQTRIRTYRDCLPAHDLQATYWPRDVLFDGNNAVVEQGLSGTEVTQHNGGGICFLFDRSSRRVFWIIWPR